MRWQDNLRLILEDCEDGRWMVLVQNHVQLQALEMVVFNYFSFSNIVFVSYNAKI
jgi:hypothetical protein